MLIDSHCHLDFPELNAELDAVLARARAAGVGLMVTISTRVGRFNELKAIVEAHDNVFCSIGTHPHNAAEEPDIMVEELVELARIQKWWRSARRGSTIITTTARATCRRRASARISPPRARPDCRSSSMPATPTPTLRACSKRRAREARFPSCCIASPAGPISRIAGLALGGYISFSGVVTFKNAEALRDIALAVPSDRLLVETDAPYLAPEPLRGKTNEPAFVVHTAARLAALRGVREAEMERLTTENFFKLFRKVPRPSLQAPQSAA